MKSLHLFLLSTLITCYLATSGDATIMCHVCESTSDEDFHCNEYDVGQEKYECVSCATTKLGNNRYKRECLVSEKKSSCIVAGLQQVCFCNADLCNAYIEFPPLIRCHKCESTSATDPSCTDIDSGEIKDGCLSCATYKVGEKRFQRSCSKDFEGRYCLFDQYGYQVCYCSTDLCNAKDERLTRKIKCHVCTSTDTSCTECDLGKEVDGCTSCTSFKLAENRFNRLCTEYALEHHCFVNNEFQQTCVCNTPLCNGYDIFQNLIKCYECNIESDSTDIVSCTDTIFGREVGGCLECSSKKIKDKVFSRKCVTDKLLLTPVGCLRVPNTCFCDTDLCNNEDVNIPIVKCYVCKPKSASDTTCNFHKSGRVKKGCLTCLTEIKKGITTRACMDYAVRPKNETTNGKRESYCNTDMCNGEGVDRVNDVTTIDPTSGGLEKMVSNSVVIGAVMTVMLVLARR